ncbi:MAG: MBL fold metallo-hydrolase, partial [Methanospirillum sp.]
MFLVVSLIAPAGAYVPDTLTVTFLDIGNADSILVQAPNGHAMLVDAGVPRDASTVTAALAAAKVSRLEYVVGTHGDNDHIGGMVGVLPHVSVGEFVNNGITVENKQGADLQSYLSAHAIPVRSVTAGDTLDLDPANVTVTVLNPQADPGTDWNEASVVLRLAFGTQSFMLTGDAGTIAEGQILASGRPVASTFLKVGHHGLGTSTGAAFVGAVDPAIAVISQAKTYINRSREVVQRLQANGATVYSTASSGTVRIEATRTGYTVDTEDGPAL